MRWHPSQLRVLVVVMLIEMLISVNYRYFTWAGDKFPHSTEMINNLAAKGRKMVTIVDPHLKKDDNYKVYADAKSRGYYVKNSNGGEYDGWCWPGEFHKISYIKSSIVGTLIVQSTL